LFEQYNDMSSNEIQSNFLFENIKNLIKESQNKIITAINNTMTLTYFEIGRMIVEEEQKGVHRADYGKQIIKTLSLKLTKDFGQGFSMRNIEQMRQFYIVYSIPQTVSAEFKLSWSHYLTLMRINDVNERSFYEIESLKNNWSLRELKRQLNSALFTRLSISKDKQQLLELSTKGQVIEKSIDVIKDPYVLEFLGLEEKSSYSESELEQKLIDRLENFLLELGTGFTFVARQKRITFEEKHFRVDLVFYNRLLKCFVLIDLKIGELKHQDIGQMQMYVNYYDREIKLEEESKTIGIILCQDKSESVVKYTLPENNEQIFASKYLTVLPSQEMLKKLLENNED
jgi:predicted nuclease of restriction endonuclease-like (RecB) superfamily